LQKLNYLSAKNEAVVNQNGCINKRINLKCCKSQQICTVFSDPIVKANCSDNKSHKTNSRFCWYL